MGSASEVEGALELSRNLGYLDAQRAPTDLTRLKSSEC
jgi:hypothetical protein